MSIASFSVRQPVLVNMIVAAVFAIGIFSVWGMPRERYPNTPLNKVFAVVIFPGTSPVEMEKLVAIPLEEKLRSLDDLEWMNTTCFEAKVTIEMKFGEDVGDLDEVGRIVQSKVEEAELPKDILEPIVIPVQTDKVMPAIQVAMGGDFSDTAIKGFADRLRKDLLDIDDAGEIEVVGARERQIWVEVDPSKAEQFLVPLRAIDEALAMRNLNVPAGKVTLGDDEYLVSTVGEMSTSADVRDVVISAESDGRMVRVRDVAEVRDTFAEQRVRYRLDRNPTVFITIYKTSGSNVVKLVDEVKRTCEDFAGKVPGLTVTFRNDQSIAVRESLSVLVSNMAMGCGLVMLILFLLMSWRGAILALIGIPFAFLATFIAMDFLGYTINTVTLFAFILVLGMLVDDAIVIIENVHRHIEMGKSRLEAAVAGTEEVIWPVTSAILTTIAAFLPMLMMQGALAGFLKLFPIIVSLCLGASVFEAFLTLPSHLRHFGPRTGEVKPRRFFVRFLGTYRRVLVVIVRHRYLSVAGFVMFSAVTIALVGLGLKTGFIPIEMFGDEELSTITMNVEMPVGTNLDDTQGAVDEMERRILAMEGRPVKSIVTTIGQVIDDHHYLTQTNVAQLDMDLGTLEQRVRKADAIKQGIRGLVDDVPGVRSIAFAEFGWGPPVGKPVEVRVVGSDMEQLRKHAGAIAGKLRTMPGVVDVRDTLAIGKDEIKIVPRPEEAARYRMSNAAIALTVRNALEGTVATKLREPDGDEVDVVVKLDQESGGTVGDVKALRLMTPVGPVALHRIADIVTGRGLAEIRRRDGERYAGVTAGVVSGVATSDSVNGELGRFLASFEAENPGYRIQFGGEAEEQAKSFGSLYRAFALAIMLVYLILGTQFRSFFQPLIVMVTIPFAFTGVFIGLMAARLPFSLLALISIVGLAGVVVNDAIVLVDFANRSREQGMGAPEAAIEAGVTRIRAIIMTTTTTIGGLLPLAIGLGGSSEAWKPMAITMCSGLGFSTLLTLFLIPALWTISEDIATRTRRIGSGEGKDHSR